MAEMPEVLTMAEAAKYFRVHQATLKRWRKQGLVPASKLGKRVLFRKAALASVLQQQEGHYAAMLKAASAANEDEL